MHTQASAAKAHQYDTDDMDDRGDEEKMVTYSHHGMPSSAEFQHTAAQQGPSGQHGRFGTVSSGEGLNPPQVLSQQIYCC